MTVATPATITAKRQHLGLRSVLSGNRFFADRAGDALDHQGLVIRSAKLVARLGGRLGIGGTRFRFRFRFFGFLRFLIRLRLGVFRGYGVFLRILYVTAPQKYGFKVVDSGFKGGV